MVSECRKVFVPRAPDSSPALRADPTIQNHATSSIARATRSAPKLLTPTRVATNYSPNFPDTSPSQKSELTNVVVTERNVIYSDRLGFRLRQPTDVMSRDVNVPSCSAAKAAATASSSALASASATVAAADASSAARPNCVTRFLRSFGPSVEDRPSFHAYCSVIATRPRGTRVAQAGCAIWAMALSLFTVLVQLYALWSIAFVSVGDYHCMSLSECPHGMYCNPSTLRCSDCSLADAVEPFGSYPPGENRTPIYYRSFPGHPDSWRFHACPNRAYKIAKEPLLPIFELEPRYTNPHFFPQWKDAGTLDLSQLGSDAMVSRAIESMWKWQADFPTSKDKTLHANNTAALWCASAAWCELTDPR